LLLQFEDVLLELDDLKRAALELLLDLDLRSVFHDALSSGLKRMIPPTD